MMTSDAPVEIPYHVSYIAGCRLEKEEARKLRHDIENILNWRCLDHKTKIKDTLVITKSEWDLKLH